MSENKQVNLTVTPEYDGWRIDKFLAETHSEFSRSVWQKMIKDGKISVSGKSISSGNAKITSGMNIEIEELPQEQETPLPQPEDIPLDIIFEDDNLIVINKPAGMVVHPGDGTEHGTVVNAILNKFANFADSFEDKLRPGIVHRLDKDTSGILLIAKNQQSLERLQEMFKNREIKKTYLALIHGNPKKLNDTVTHAIARHPVNRKKMAVNKTGKNAVTHFSVIKQGYIENQPISLLEVQIETGRTHQIRVHMSEIHLPIVGDHLYGGSRRVPHAPRQMLHAWELQFMHPLTGRKIDISCPIPEDIEELIEKMK